MHARDGSPLAGDFHQRRGALAALLPLLFALASHAAAAEPAGRVISVAGAVTATDEDGPARALEHGDAVFAGDTLALGARAHAQLRMRDDALLELEADSRFAIERYDAHADGGNVLMRLLRGAMRTITGAIGDRERDEYAVETPVATIGVRGTQYALHICAADCADEDRAEGLYGRVDAGAVAAANDAARRRFARNQYFYIAAADVPPREIVRPPEGVLDGGAVSQGELVPPEEDFAGGGAVGGSVGDALEGTTETLGDTVEAVGSGTGGAIGDLGGAVGDTIGGGAGDAVGSLSEGAGTGVESLGEGAGEAIDSLGSGDLDDATESLTDGTGDTVEELTDGTEEALDDVGDSLEDLL